MCVVIKMIGIMKKRINIILEEEIIKAGKKAAQKDDRSFSAYIGQLIKRNTQLKK